MRLIVSFASLTAVALILSACAAASVVGSAVSVAGSAVSATASVAGGAVGAVAGGSDDEDED